MMMLWKTFVLTCLNYRSQLWLPYCKIQDATRSNPEKLHKEDRHDITCQQQRETDRKDLL